MGWPVISTDALGFLQMCNLLEYLRPRGRPPNYLQHHLEIKYLLENKLPPPADHKKSIKKQCNDIFLCHLGLLQIKMSRYSTGTTMYKHTFQVQGESSPHKRQCFLIFKDYLLMMNCIFTPKIQIVNHNKKEVKSNSILSSSQVVYMLHILIELLFYIKLYILHSFAIQMQILLVTSGNNIVKKTTTLNFLA